MMTFGYFFSPQDFLITILVGGVIVVGLIWLLIYSAVKAANRKKD